MNLDRPIAPDPYEVLPPVPSFTLSSEDVANGEPMGPEFAHTSVGGENLSPQLSWSGFPEQTRSFAVTCFDPDAPTGCGWWHWMLLNVPASVTQLPRGAGGGTGSTGGGVLTLRNDFGDWEYGGAAPPAGDRPHRYVFAVHALDVEWLDLTRETPAAPGAFNIMFQTLARAVIRPTYQVKE